MSVEPEPIEPPVDTGLISFAERMEARWDAMSPEEKQKRDDDRKKAEQEVHDREAYQLIDQSNIPARHRRLRFNEVYGDEWKSALEYLKKKTGTGFTGALIGIRGSGKTQLGVEIIRHTCRTLNPARYVTAMDIFMAIKSSYRRDSTRSEMGVLREFQNVHLLVIDEMQERGESDWEDRLITHLINKRYNDMKDTVLIANQTLTAFQQGVGDSIVSRINEDAGIIECNWKSFRDK